MTEKEHAKVITLLFRRVKLSKYGGIVCQQCSEHKEVGWWCKETQFIWCDQCLAEIKNKTFQAALDEVI
jgi:hypothetical protein